MLVVAGAAEPEAAAVAAEIAAWPHAQTDEEARVQAKDLLRLMGEARDLYAPALSMTVGREADRARGTHSRDGFRPADERAFCRSRIGLAGASGRGDARRRRNEGNGASR